MTTHTYNTALNHSGDTGFQAWAQEFHLGLIAAGLVNTSDTGQVDLTTAARPASNTAAGYKIYRFNDSLQASRPVFLKVEFGTGSVAANPSAWIQMGIGTDGAGTLSPGMITPRQATLRNNSAPASTTNPYLTRMCCLEGYIGVAHKSGSMSPGHGGFHVMRTVDGDGNPNGDGVTMLCLPSAHTIDVLSFVDNRVISHAGRNYCLVPLDYTSSIASPSADIQHYKHYTATPRMRVNPFLLTINITDTPEGTQRSFAPIGTVSRNYISLGVSGGTSTGAGASASFGLMMPWQ